MSCFADSLAHAISSHVDHLCRPGPDRMIGTRANELAVEYAEGVMRGLGLPVASLPFETQGWRPGTAAVDLPGHAIPLHPGPYSPPLEATAPLALASTAGELSALVSARAAGSILVLRGEIATEQLTPRDYPFYASPAHAAILDDIERLAPAAIVAVTGKNPATTAALSPFPLVEDGAFSIPSAYLAVEEASQLVEAARSGAVATVTIDSSRFPVTGRQPVGLLGAASYAETLSGPRPRRRALVCGHIDTKHDTPGALDNATGVATMLAVAELLAAEPPAHVMVEFVPFNGEDHYAAPGEMAYLAAHPPGEDLALVVNIDGAGYRAGPSALSTFGLPDGLERAAADLLETHCGVVEGEPWIASDHAVFAMQGIPAVAVTSAGLDTIMESIAHTPADTPDLVDAEVLADTARLIAALVRAAR